MRTSPTGVVATRGMTIDVTGVVLANSIQTYDTAVNQLNTRAYVHRDGNGNEVGRGPAEAARQLVPLLGMNGVKLDSIMLGDSTYEHTERNVDAMTYRGIRELSIYGIEQGSVFEHEYPNGNAAAPVIGTVNADEQDSSGIETQFDAFLIGTPDAQVFGIASNDAVMPGGKKTTVEPKNGDDVELTTHADLQHQVQNLPDVHVVKHHVNWGVVAVGDVATGHVLVMAGLNSTEPDNVKPQRVYAVQDTFEPGSMGRLVTMGVALNQGTISLMSVFQIPYALDLPDIGGPIMDFHEYDGETLTVTSALTESSNVGTVLTGQMVSDDQRYSMTRAFGFGQETGIELPGKSTGLLCNADQWQGRDRYVAMFGQAYVITAIQEASALTTIVNGGAHISPHIVKSWTNVSGMVEIPGTSQPVQVMGAQATSQLLTVMKSVVEDERDTVGAAKVLGYRVGMKTGTAKTVTDGAAGLVSTTAGTIPADMPCPAVAVVLYNPKMTSVSPDSSAPLFGDIARTTVASLGIPASTGSASLYPATP